ncbi:arylesterase [Pseudodesulfovibrio portus]|uniref:Arylesterase n=1 Tax=Pseudodesulfovibrio portus TaxID=231439 RepID=A0ABM8ANJ3_9BACT|nr:arylesterase [Pseudodesulfovibrio portus]BDQ32962.1 arylesterase [Pseudodesulfovibrio portus]
MQDGTVRIACFGDSLTEGYGLAPREALPNVLERLLREEGLPARCLNFGVSGETFEDGLIRVHKVLQSGPDAVILEFGANDCFMGDSVQTIRDNATAILDTLRSHGLPVLLVGITAHPEIGAAHKAEFDPMFGELAEEYGLPLFPDILAPYYPDPSRTLLDGLHPNAQGVEAMARALLPQVIELVQTAQKRD